MALPLLLVLGLALLWSGYWYLLSSKAQELYASARSDMAAKGMTLSCAKTAWGGFPFRLTMKCANPEFIVTAQGKSTTVTAGSLLVLMQAYDYRHFIAVIDGPSRLSEEGSPALDFAFDQLTSSLVLSNGKPARLGVEIPLLAIGKLGSANNILLNASIDSFGNLAAAASAKNLKTFTPKPFALDSATFEVTTPAAIITSADPLRTMAGEGVKFDVTHFEAARGKLIISAEGEAGLNPDARLEGQATATVSDLELLIAEIRQSAILADKDVDQIHKFMKVFIAGNPRPSFMLKATAGAISWGPLKIAELPPFL